MENLELFYAAVDLMADLFNDEYVSICHIDEVAPDDYKAIFVLNRPNIDSFILDEIDKSYDDPSLKNIKPPSDKEEIDAWLQEQSAAYKFFVYMGMMSAATEDRLGFYEQENLNSIPEEYQNIKCYIVIYDQNWETSSDEFQKFEDGSLDGEVNDVQ